MKFSLSRDVLTKVLRRIDSVCANRASFLILASCLIEAKNGQITVTGTDLDITLRIIEDATVMEEGVIAINSKRLLDTVSNLAAGTEVNFSTDSSNAVVEAGNFRARIPLSDALEFPPVPQVESGNTLTMSADLFKLLIDRTMFSISKDEGRIDFTGALLKVTPEGTIQMVSTDGHRLSRAESAIHVSGTVSKFFETGVIIPKKGLAELTKNLCEGDVNLRIDNNKIIVDAVSTLFYINLIPGSFPDFSKVIPTHLDHKAVVQRENFQQMLKRSSVFVSKTGTIRLSMAAGRLEVSAYDSKNGDMRDFVEAEYDGTGVTAGFNWRYIDEVLAVLDCDKVSVEIIDMDSPAVIRQVGSDQFDFIIMPMQL